MASFLEPEDEQFLDDEDFKKRGRLMSENTISNDQFSKIPTLGS